MKPNRNIIRLDRQNGGGFLVRVTRKGKLRSDYFRDQDHGGKKKALLAARKYRDELEAKYKRVSSKELAKRVRSNNTSGEPGVRYVEEIDHRWDSKPCYGYWIAQWSPRKGVRKTKRFSVLKYGDDEAFRLAVKARRKGVSEMES